MSILGTLYPLFKTLHIFGFVAWFSGLFYLVRIFVYHVEASDKPEPDRTILQTQYRTMEWRVYRIIINPAMMITWTFGLLMLIVNGLEWLGLNFWMQVKLLLLLGLIGYQFWCKSIIRKLERDENKLTSFQFRLANELPTLFLLSIVLLAVYRNTIDFLIAFAGIIAFGILLFGGAKLYKRQREARKEN